MSARVSAVIPALDEAGTIASVVVAAVLRAGVDEVIVVDNGSRDATAALAAAAGARVVHEPRRGYGAACRAGIAAISSRSEIVLFLDADGADDPDDIAAVVGPVAQGRADLAVGSRLTGEHEQGALAPAQRFGNWLAGRLLGVLYGEPASDLGPLRAIRREALAGLGMRAQSFGWTVEMQARAAVARLRVVEVAVRYRRRTAGRSKISGTVWGSLRAGTTILWTLASVRVTAGGLTRPPRYRR